MVADGLKAFLFQLPKRPGEDKDRLQQTVAETTSLCEAWNGFAASCSDDDHALRAAMGHLLNAIDVVLKCCHATEMLRPSASCVRWARRELLVAIKSEAPLLTSQRRLLLTMAVPSLWLQLKVTRPLG